MSGGGANWQCPPQLIVSLEANKLSLRKIGAELESRGIKTARGGDKWQASSIKAVLESTTARGEYGKHKDDI